MNYKRRHVKILMLVHLACQLSVFFFLSSLLYCYRQCGSIPYWVLQCHIAYIVLSRKMASCTKNPFFPKSPSSPLISAKQSHTTYLYSREIENCHTSGTSLNHSQAYTSASSTAPKNDFIPSPKAGVRDGINPLHPLTTAPSSIFFL